MKYTYQKTFAFIKIVLGFFVIGYHTGKFIKNGDMPDALTLLFIISIGILLPLSSLFSLKMIKRQQQEEKNAMRQAQD